MTSHNTTQAYVLEKVDAPFILRDVILDTVRDDEVLVEIKYTGLCHTDLVVQQGGMPGNFPAVLGHEGVAVVKHVGAAVKDKTLSPGDTVILSYHNCKACRQCHEGRGGACIKMTELNFLTSRLGDPKTSFSLPDGTPVHGQFFGQSSLSRMAVVAQHSVVKIEGARPEDLAALPPLACGYLTGAGTVLNVLKPRTDDTVAVLGAGAVGFAAIMAAKVSGAKAIIAVDIVEEKLQLALSLGATHVINTSATRDLDSAIRATFPDGVDRILDTTGVEVLLNGAFRALAHDGTLALVGVPSQTAELKFNALEMLSTCKKVVGVIEGHADSQKLIPYMVQLHRDGKFPVEKICKMYAAEDLDKALADLKAGKVIKPILSW
ncbi:putative aryl-alcohol dehydrogenase [Sarocladium strictum]